MAIAKKGARRIVVEGESYRWIVSPDDEPGLGIIVEKDNSYGQRLIAWVEHGSIITPAIVRKAILYALTQGWKPSEQKRQMTLRLEQEFLESGAMRKAADEG